MLHRLIDVISSPFLATPWDKWKYRELRRAREDPATRGRVARVRIRQLNGAAVEARYGTTDYIVLQDTFDGSYHVPPIALAEDATVLDLGANVGYTTAHFATMFPRGRVIGVELDGGNATLASRNTVRYGARVQVLQVAAWSTDGEVVYDADARAWGFRAQRDASVPVEHLVRVRAMTMASIRAETCPDRLDYVKMDIEGAEHEVLSGELHWLQGVHAIKIEVHPPATVEFCLGRLRDAGMRASLDHVHHACVIGLR